ncbi:MAG: protein-glutamate O-methyltransferase CheR [Caulobacteraceae bacterium]|nr:protein-glutamate O-methyltransferase CheR [Caulobacteraceae bacterium]
MRPDLAEFFRDFVLRRTGIVLAADKDYLLRTRLEPLARSEGLADVNTMMSTVRMQPTGPLAQKCLDAMATHESFFFRDQTPFDAFRDDVLPRLARARPEGRLRVWCAACSSGQEPYSLGMLFLEERHKHPPLTLSIVATDISEPILQRARSGLYSDFETSRGLTPERRARWFSSDRGTHKVVDDVRAMVQFRRHNLLEPTAALGKFDVIFCRNVLIYFDRATKQRVLDGLTDAVAPDGVIFLGAAETVVGLSGRLRPRPGLRGVFERTDAAAVRAA